MITLKYCLWHYKGKFFIGDTESKSGLPTYNKEEHDHYHQRIKDAVVIVGYNTAKILDNLKTDNKKYDYIDSKDLYHIDFFSSDVVIIGGVKTYKKYYTLCNTIEVSIIQLDEDTYEKRKNSLIEINDVFNFNNIEDSRLLQSHYIHFYDTFTLHKVGFK